MPKIRIENYDLQQGREGMSSSMLVILMAFSCCIFVLSTDDIRHKRQLSPAVRLENELRPLLVGMYGYGPEQMQFKRSRSQLKRHVSPSFDVEVDAGNMRNLLDIGKRQVSVANDLGGQVQMYSRLFDAGKRSLSPAHDLEHSLELSDFLERAGRRRK
ncbi:unnamed protein product [Caenorhabditis auriculariae]|uniref:Uncharacterized protein n=1 Tax=Caenorhabditis auriculariae TaxID=2777116 RepID=A0A8S1HRK7_9PELO|nr:unnamed protein product [Caenorhabditis auriculariae]